MIRVHERLRKEHPAARLVLQVHDELIVETPRAEVDTVSQLIKEEMTTAFVMDPPLTVDTGVGANWLAAK
jgi:DNA polymerase-1